MASRNRPTISDLFEWLGLLQTGTSIGAQVTRLQPAVYQDFIDRGWRRWALLHPGPRAVFD